MNNSPKQQLSTTPEGVRVNQDQIRIIGLAWFNPEAAGREAAAIYAGGGRKPGLMAGLAVIDGATNTIRPTKWVVKDASHATAQVKRGDVILVAREGNQAGQDQEGTALRVVDVSPAYVACVRTAVKPEAMKAAVAWMAARADHPHVAVGVNGAWAAHWGELERAIRAR